MSESRPHPLRLLFITPYLPSPIRVRPYQIIRHLTRLGHQVTLAAIDADQAPGDDAALVELRAVCKAVHVVPLAKWRARLRSLVALPTPTPLWAAYCRAPEVLRSVRDLAATGAFDVAHVEHLRAAFVAPALGGLYTVYDAVDCIADLQRQMASVGGPAARLLAWEEWVKLRRYEPRICAAFDRVAVTTALEAEKLTRLAEAANVPLPPLAAIPNGVDLEQFRPRPDVESEPDTLVFSGKLSYRANSDAARFLLTEVLPRVRARRPDARLLLVGSGPSDDLRALARSVGGVEITGYVDDLCSYLARARVAICPLRIAVGIQNKALEALATGVPVVCAPPAAHAISDAPVRVAESAEALADACVTVLNLLEDRWQEESRTARTYVEAHHHWDDAARAFEALYRSALAEPRRTGG